MDVYVVGQGLRVKESALDSATVAVLSVGPTRSRQKPHLLWRRCHVFGTGRSLED